MKQMIIRLDDELHARLKEQAAVEGCSINEFVTAALILALGGSMARHSVREQAEMPNWRDVDLVSVSSGRP